MHDTLADKLHALRRSVRVWSGVLGAGWLTIVALGGLLLVGGLDWLLHLDDPGVRLVLGGSLLAGCGYVAWRFLVRPLTVPLTDRTLALKIEERYPVLKDGLASAVQFLDSGRDPRLGSPALQEQAVEATVRQLARLDVADVVQTRTARKIAGIAAGVAVVVLVAAAANPARAGTALVRLLFPFGAHPWPRAVELRLLDAQWQVVPADPTVARQAARGTRLEFLVENARGALPERVVLEVRVGDDPPVTERLRRAALRDETGRARDVCGVSFTAARGPLSFRVAGGDDDTMPWLPIEVVPPPTLDELRVVLVPPAYTGRPAETLPPGTGHVQGLVGTRVELEARANKPLGSAVLRVRDVRTVPIERSEDDRLLRAAFVVDEAGTSSYWFDLVDRQGFSNPESPRYELRGTADQVPEVRIEEPATDLTVTPTATIPFRVLAKDDLRLATVELHFEARGEGDPTPGVVRLFPHPADEAPDQRPDAAAGARPDPRAAPPDGPTEDRLDRKHLWDLAPLQLAAGHRVVVHAEATDFFDLGPTPHRGRSTTRTFTIVEPDQKTSELLQRELALHEDLDRLRKQQEQAHQQVRELLVQLGQAGRLRPEDHDLLKRVELDQRQIATKLSHPADGLESQARALVEEARRNRLDVPEAAGRWNRVVDELSVLRESHLPRLERRLTEAAKESQSRRAPESRAPQGTAARSEPAASDPSSKPSPAPTGDPSRSPDPSAGSQSTKSAGSPQKTETPNNPESKQPADPASRSTPDPDDPRGAGDSKPTPATSRPDARPVPGGQTLHDALGETAEGQAEIVERLDVLRGLLSQWRDRRRLQGETDDVVAEQRNLNRETAERSRPALERRPGEPTPPQERADLSRLADRQRRQAGRLSRLQADLQEASKRLADSDPETADAFAEAAEWLRDKATAGALRDAADNLERGEIGRTLAGQSDALQQLDELRGRLERRPTTDAETLVKQLHEAADEAARLRDRQEELLRKAEDLGRTPEGAEKREGLETLRKEQRDLRDAAARLERRLQRLELDRRPEAARRAVSQMERADQDLAQGKPDEAARRQQEALDDLEQAARELAGDVREAEERLAQELLEKIAGRLQALVPRQQHVVDEIARLDAEYRTRGNWSRAQLKTLLDLVGVQNALRTETGQLVETLKAAEVFALALKGAAQQMQIAADRLGERKTDARTLAAAVAARKRCEDLVAALKSAEDSPPQQGDAGAPAGQGQQPDKNAGPPSDGIPQLAQLLLLRSLQQDLFDRTAALETRRAAAAGTLAAEDLAELALLAEEQSRLADLARNMTRALAGAAAPDGPAKPRSGDHPDPPSKPGEAKRKDGPEPSKGAESNAGPDAKTEPKTGAKPTPAPRETLIPE